MSLIVTGEPPLPDVAHDAHDFVWVGAVVEGFPFGANAGHIRHPEALADGILSMESVLGHHLINHNDRFIAQAVVLVEEPAFAQRDAHHL